MRALSCVSTIFVVAAFTSSAHAEFGEAGDVSFAADRLSGIYLYDGGPFNVTALGLGASADVAAYTTARIGIDGVIVDHLTLGGNIALWHFGDDADTTGFLIYPRVGYVIAFDDTWGFWPRGGVTFTTFDNDRFGGRDDDELALTLEAMFFAAVTDHFGFSFGPLLDLGMVGDGPEARNIGLLTGGVFGWL